MLPTELSVILASFTLALCSPGRHMTFLCGMPLLEPYWHPIPLSKVSVTSESLHRTASKKTHKKTTAEQSPSGYFEHWPCCSIIQPASAVDEIKDLSPRDSVFVFYYTDTCSVKLHSMRLGKWRSHLSPFL